MIIKEQYKKYIEQAVKESRYYEGNEYLFDEFCESIYQKTYLILATKQSEIELKEYLKGVTHRVIISVLKKYAYDNYINKKQNDISMGLKHAFSKEETPLYNYEKIQDIVKENQKAGYLDYEPVPDPLLYVKHAYVTKDYMKKVVKAIYEIHENMPNKYYFQIFYYKYFKQMNQNKIAKILGLTQSELSKRLIELTQNLKGNGVI